MAIELDQERKDVLLDELKSHYSREFDEQLSDFRASHLLEFFLKKLGPTVYNQAIQDARRFIQERVDDLDTEFYQTE